MKVAILGGGLTGLTAAYYLAKKNHQVTVFEKEKILGGQASGFKEDNWSWYVERTIHHLFANDKNILEFAKEIGFNEIFFKKPETASLYKNPNYKPQITNKFQISNFKFQIYPLDTPLNLLRFPLLSFIDRIRAGIVLGFIKFSPFFLYYEKLTAEEFLKKTMGEKNWRVLWQELFRKKFGKYAGKILASFIWARIKKRTRSLGYPRGGFQTLINHLENTLISLRINALTGCQVERILKRGKRFLINNEEFDGIISTLPTPILTTVAREIFSADYINRLNKINHLHSISLVIESEKPLFKKTYWMNILAPEIPIMGLFQQTNFIDKKNYGGKNILYCGWYTAGDDKLWSMDKDEIVDYISSYLNEISNFKFQISNSWLFKARFAQPIFDKEFLENKPEIVTPVKNFFIANLEMTYPYDRGTNFAVKLGKQVANLI